MAAGLEPIFLFTVAVCAFILLTGAVLHRLRQPYVLAYIIAGVVLGPGVLGIISTDILLSEIGSLGIALLLFFLGMEVSLPRIIGQWRIAVLGTLAQILVSLGLAWLLGWYLGWGAARIVLLGFVISLSSTAVVMKILENLGETRSVHGERALGVLLVQDVMIAPMLIVLSLLGGKTPTGFEVSLLLIGAVLVFAVFWWVASGRSTKLPFPRALMQDHEMQVFVALLVCVGFAALTGWFGLSSALGAFVAGMWVSAADSASWVHDRIQPLQVFFLAAFFLSVGAALDLSFAFSQWPILLALVFAALLTNTFINAGILRVLGGSWAESLYFGSLLAQIGEFSFVLAAVGLAAGIIGDFAYQTTVAVIALSLLFSPVWIKTVQSATSYVAQVDR